MTRRWIAVALLVGATAGCTASITPDRVVGHWDLAEFEAPDLPAAWEPTVEFWEFRPDGLVIVASAINDGDGRWSVAGSRIGFSDVKISAVGSPDPVVTAGENALLTLIFADSVDVRFLDGGRMEISNEGTTAILERRP